MINKTAEKKECQGESRTDASRNLYSRNNYAYAKDRIRPEFLAYDQETMIRRLGLAENEAYLFLDFAGARYRIDRRTGEVERLYALAVSDTDADKRKKDEQERQPFAREADYLETLSVYDFLCFSKEEIRPGGQWCLVNSLPGVGQNSGLGDNLFTEDAVCFDRNPEGFVRACKEMGGKETGFGDIGFELPVFPKFQVRLRFYRSDEEFPASLSVFFDISTLKYLHYETTYYVVSCLIRELKRRMEE